MTTPARAYGRGSPTAQNRQRLLDESKVAQVRTLAEAGASLYELGQIIGTRNYDTVHRFLIRNGIRRVFADGVEAQMVGCRDDRYLPLLVVIPPVREAGHGKIGGGGFDLEDTGEL